MGSSLEILTFLSSVLCAGVIFTWVYGMYYSEEKVEEFKETNA